MSYKLTYDSYLIFDLIDTMPPKKKTNKPNEEPTDKSAPKEEKPLPPPQ